jgi:hypothetical protein
MATRKINLSLADLNMSDTSGYDKYKDASVVANAEVIIGEYEKPAGSKGVTWGGAPVFIELNDDTTTQVREEGTFIFYVEGVDGSKHKVYEYRSQSIGANGQEDTPSEHMHLPAGGKFGQKLILAFRSDASDTLDSTDHVVRTIPAVVLY